MKLQNNFSSKEIFCLQMFYYNRNISNDTKIKINLGNRKHTKNSTIKCKRHIIFSVILDLVKM